MGKSKKLELRRETLKILNTQDLRNVQGGSTVACFIEASSEMCKETFHIVIHQISEWIDCTQWTNNCSQSCPPRKPHALCETGGGACTQCV